MGKPQSLATREKIRQKLLGNKNSVGKHLGPRNPQDIIEMVNTRKANGSYKAWNDGLTKETDSRVLAQSVAFKGKGNPIFHNPDWEDMMRQKGLKVWRNGHPTARIRNIDIEIKVQRELKERSIKYLTHQVMGDRWVVDILLVDYPIVIECDGDYWHSSPEATRRDSIKTLGLNNLGYKVIRLRGEWIKHDLSKCIRLVEDIVRTTQQCVEMPRNEASNAESKYW